MCFIPSRSLTEELFQWVTKKTTNDLHQGLISARSLVLHSRRDFYVNISKVSTERTNHLCIAWPTHIAAEEGKNSVLHYWALCLNKTTVQNIFHRIPLFLDGKTCIPRPSQDVILRHKQSLQSAVPLQFCLFSTNTDFADAEIVCGGEETWGDRMSLHSKTPAPLLSLRALSTDMVHTWEFKRAPNFNV